jgi:chorismate synthase
MTAGESHGPLLLGILDGMPAGLPLREGDLLPRMRRRQGGYGRGKRMTFESDRPQIVGGLWKGVTTGAPVGVVIENRSNRQGRTQVRKTTPRPGHADLAGMLKYGFDDANPVIERASARETAIRTALGAVACHLLEALDVRLTGHVIAMGGVEAPPLRPELGPSALEAARDRSEVACVDPEAGRAMIARVDEARERGESLGGRVELVAWDPPAGLGSYAQWDRRLDARLSQVLASIPAVKGVEIGQADELARAFGRSAHDPITRDGEGIGRPSNRAGGLEGGVTNGEPLVVRVTLKPIPTQRKPLDTVDLDTGEPISGRYIRSDVAVVPAAAVIVEALAGLVLADALLESHGQDRLEDLRTRLAAHRARMPRYPETR